MIPTTKQFIEALAKYEAINGTLSEETKATLIRRHIEKKFKIEGEND